MISPEEIKVEVDKLYDKHEELLVEITRASANLTALCTKFDKFLDDGAPRCATHNAEISHVKKNLKALWTVSGALFAGIAASFWRHLFG